LRLLLFTGQGGAGTTTLAAASAVHAARRGLKTVLITMDGEAWPACAAPGVGPLEEGGLTVDCIDPRIRRTEGSPGHGLGGLIGEVFQDCGLDTVLAELIGVLPGVDEVVTLLALRELATQRPADLVVADLGPLSQALRLLGLPHAAAVYADQMLTVGRRVHRAMTRTVDPLPSLVDQLTGRLGAVGDLLTDPATAVRVVIAPGRIGARTAARALGRLALQGCAVDAVVVNRARQIGAEHHDLAGPGRRVHTLATAEGEPVDVEALDALGSQLTEATVEVASDPLIAVNALAGNEFELTVRLPMVARDELDLHRVEDALVIQVGLERRVITLPSALRRCRVVGAHLPGGGSGRAELRVRFEPDPALWRPL
jgi:arsenite-transporting ATPase